MLVIVSDLHLTDTVARSTFNAATFGRTVEAVVREAATEGVEDVRLILLGDVFEILKSTRWLNNGVRPWETVTQRHQDTVRQIVEGVIASNSDFFAAMKTIRGAHKKIGVTYVIGNHDRPLNTAMGTGSRAIIRESLSLSGGDALFPEAYDDPEHAVLAQHGHLWDEMNRYRGNNIAIGDAIVIDVVARLPILFAKRLAVEPDNPILRFVHEIDNVIPQTPYRMAMWLAEGLKTLDENAGARLNTALGEIAEDLTQRIKPYTTESPIGKWWVQALKNFAVHFGPMQAALKLPSGGSAPPPLAGKVGFDLEQSYGRHGVDYRYVIYGHTHIPDFRSIATPRGVKRYLNCGTWRRLHRAVDATVGKVELPYASTDAHAFVIIRHPSEISSGQPSYELRQSFHD